MTEIDVPDWVVKAADEAGDEFAKTHTMSMYASLADMQRDCVRHMLTAALGAWVVQAAKIGACAEVQWLQGGPCQLPPNEIIYTLRQEKPE